MNDANPTDEGAWIFLSHSNKDFEKVREIRNELEKLGHKPIMFFLKCLDSDSALLPELLKQEIAARHWFLLCDSPHSQASKWVQDEVTLIRAMKDKVFRTVDLRNNLDAELHKLEELSKRATVFISCAHSDREVADRIRRLLLRHDYRVCFTQADGTLAQDYAQTVKTGIDSAVNRGFVLVLLSVASLTSKWCQQETEYALRLSTVTGNNNIICLMIDPEARHYLPELFPFIAMHDLGEEAFDQQIESLIVKMKTREMT
jgi:hypothetical protein